MTFDDFVEKAFPNFDLSKDTMTVGGEWMKKFWATAQQQVVKDVAAKTIMDNPVTLRVVKSVKRSEIV